MVTQVTLTSRDRRIFDAVHTAKEWINSAVSQTIQDKLSHSQMLQAVNRYLETEWFRSVPSYRKYEVRGHKEALIAEFRSAAFSECGWMEALWNLI